MTALHNLAAEVGRVVGDLLGRPSGWVLEIDGPQINLRDPKSGTTPARLSVTGDAAEAAAHLSGMLDGLHLAARVLGERAADS